MATDYPVPDRFWALAAKVETTYGVDVTPTFATNAVRLMEEPTIETEFVAENLRDDWFTGGLGQLAEVSPSGQMHRIGLSMPIYGAGSAYASTNAPGPDPFLRAAGFTVAFTTASVSYAFTDAPGTGLSIYTRKEGKEYHTTGCVVTDWEIVANDNEYPVLNCNLVGIAKATAMSEVDIGSITLPTVVPPVFKNSPTTLSSYEPVVRSFALSCQNQVATRGDGSNALGLAGFRITRRALEYRPVVEHADISDYNPEAARDVKTQTTLDKQVGATQYNYFTLDADDMRVSEVGFSVEDGLVLVEPVYRIFTPSSGTELAIKFL